MPKLVRFKNALNLQGGKSTGQQAELGHFCMWFVVSSSYSCAVPNKAWGCLVGILAASVQRDVKPVARAAGPDDNSIDGADVVLSAPIVVTAETGGCAPACSVRSGIKADYDRSGTDVNGGRLSLAARRLERRRRTSTFVDRPRCTPHSLVLRL